MPTYDYVCEACGHELEHFQSMTDKRLEKCPKCGKKKLVRKVGSGGGVIFKGSGFYETDYKRAAAKGADAVGAKGSESKPSDASRKPDASKPDATKPGSSKDAASKAPSSAAPSSPSAKPAPGTCAAGDDSKK